VPVDGHAERELGVRIPVFVVGSLFDVAAGVLDELGRGVRDLEDVCGRPYARRARAHDHLVDRAAGASTLDARRGDAARRNPRRSRRRIELAAGALQDLFAEGLLRQDRAARVGRPMLREGPLRRRLSRTLLIFEHASTVAPPMITATLRPRITATLGEQSSTHICKTHTVIGAAGARRHHDEAGEQRR